MPENRVLIIEDEDDIAQGIAINLELMGYDCAVIRDGSGVEPLLLRDSSFDIAVLDIMLPVRDGFSLLPVLTQYNIPVIFLSAKSDAVSKIKGLKGGAEDYMTKPFDMGELAVRIEKILAREGKLDRLVKFRDITADTEKRTVTVKGKNVPLRPLEFDLLVKLIRNKNCTLRREKLLNEIWGIDFIGGTRTVDVHVAHLRKKLSIEKELVSVPKIGYRLED